LQGLSLKADAAMNVGLVDELTDGDLASALEDRLQRLRRAAPGAVASTKQLLQRMRGRVPDLRDEAAIAFASALRGPEARDGLAAFAKKRPAPWVDHGKP
jgi:isohexenylglutaconyl-CoA hydratase